MLLGARPCGLRSSIGRVFGVGGGLVGEAFLEIKLDISTQATLF